MSERDPDHERIQMGAIIRYGSTGSLSSLASDRVSFQSLLFDIVVVVVLGCSLLFMLLFDVVLMLF